MDILPMSVSDERIVKLFSEHDDEMLRFLGEDKRYYTRYSEKEGIEKAWAAVLGGQPIGCIAYRTKAEGVGEAKRLYIQKAHRGNDYAKELLKAVESHAKQQGCRTLFLDTRITLEPAVSLYRRVGFGIVFQQGLYIQMEKKL